MKGINKLINCKLPRRHLFKASLASSPILLHGGSLVNVADFPDAIGDGEADATVALNRAAQALPENGVLYLPRGRTGSPVPSH